MTETTSGPIIIWPELLHPINEAETMAVFALSDGAEWEQWTGFSRTSTIITA